MIHRTFRILSAYEYSSFDENFDSVGNGFTQSLSWNDLYSCNRILLVSEAGTGKTYECKEQASILAETGQPAFYINLSHLAKTDNESELIDDECRSTFKSWIQSQSEVATFFLDSLDELSLYQPRFEIALTRFKGLIKHQFNKVQVIITTRPTKDRLKTLKTDLPFFQNESSSVSLREEFASKAMGADENMTNYSAGLVQNDWCVVTLESLNFEQIRQIAHRKKVKNTDEFIEKIADSNVHEFLTRPLDVINLIECWNSNNFFSERKNQVDASIKLKLSQPDIERSESYNLSVERADEGAKKLALALLLLNKLALKYDPKAEMTVNCEPAINPREILTNWKKDEIDALLQRSLFEFSSQGCLKIYHRSVLEFLGAKQLMSLMDETLGVSRLLQILFSSFDGKYSSRSSSLGAIAAWLAPDIDRIYEILRDNEPTILMTEGDPESLSIERRKQVLKSYLRHCRKSDEGGTIFLSSQVARFATKELASIITRAWKEYSSNQSVRFTLLAIIKSAKIEECSEIAFETASDTSVIGDERLAGLEALVSMNDGR